MMKIAILGALDTPINNQSIGGTEVRTYNYCQNLIEKGYQVTLFASENSQISGKVKIVAKRSEIEDSTFKDLVVSGPKIEVLAIQAALDLLKIEKNFDLIQVNMPNFHYLLPIFTLFHKPVFITVHSFNLKFNEYQLLFQKYQQIHYLFFSNTFEKFLPKPKLYTVVPSGIKIEDYPFNDQPKDYFLWAARIHPDKGIEDAVKFAQLSGENLLVAGPIRNRDYFNQNLKPFLNKKIKYIGEITGQKKRKFFQQAKGFLMTTKRDETFGFSLIEALASGTPIISYQRGAVSDTVVNGLNGFTVKPDDVYGLVKAAKKIKLIDRKKCRQIAEDNYTVDKMTEGHLSLFAKTLKTKR